MTKPLFWSALGWATGISVGMYVSLPVWVWGLATVGGIIVGFICYLLLGRYMIVFGILASIAGGATQIQWVEASNVSHIPADLGEQESIKGTIYGKTSAPVEVDGDQARVAVKVDRFKTGKREVSLQGEEMVLQIRLQREEDRNIREVKRGRSFRAVVEIKRPDPARNPGAFDYRQYLYHRGIHWTAKVDAVNQMVFFHDKKSLYSKIDDLRFFLGRELDAVYAEDVAGLVRGMILGERKEVPFETENDFQVLGLVHLLAISGLHVGVFTGFSYLLLTTMGLTREKASACLLLLLPLYALLTGAGAPVVRASVMAGLGLVAAMFRRWNDSLSFWGAAALFMLWWNPYQLFEAGFQLSFSVTLALLIGVAPLSRILPFSRKWLRQLVAVTIVTQMASFPLIIYHFNEYSFLSPFLNVLVVPIVSLAVIPLAFLALMLAAFHTGLAWLPAFLSSVLLQGLIKFLSPLAATTMFRWIWATPSGWWLAGYGVICLYGLWAWTGGRLIPRYHRLLSSCLLVIWLGYASFPDWISDKELRITYLDVGQGDCAVIETPEGKVILVDGGGTLPFPKEPWQEPRQAYDVGERVVLPYLKHRGIRRVDEMVMTHGDTDHIGGLIAVADRLPVERVIRNAHPPKTVTERRLLQKVAEKKALISLPPVGKSQPLEEGIRWWFLHPSGEPGRRKDPNHDSVVFILEAYGYRILMTGDIEEEAEKEILQHWHLPEVHLLKVAHHGSRTSTTDVWLEVTQPQVAVISAGRNNRYGHPSPEVLERLEKYGTRIFRTDQQGAITLRLRPGSWQMETMEIRK
ncbi:DNA internalization-related competence protein ComEC/Rec2 [Kroppenstedtia pulmonis]|uniref:DNA internalization-related competence protein ComEC/Rec2 n=1 Tax=Kroppenstedtia pulmonis TaxID=1380685 RepID=A0A7D4CNQ9_9BACL|nr:DNA internalization-related competence protein ComEC/Rec2 [Kroppenstedtia pulmonis]QKG84978.1 DNA internalization-related competence protein ComEC/Rec2 [Kroppenstedtia pulmonis]